MRSLAGTSELIWYCVRRNGIVQRDGWLRCAKLDDLRKCVNASPDDIVEVCKVYRLQAVPPRRFTEVFMNRARGLNGIEFSFRDDLARLAPTRMIAANLSFERALDKFLLQRDIDLRTFVAHGSLRTFSAEQFLLKADKGNGRIDLFRGSTLVDEKPAISRTAVAEMADGIGQWMINNQCSDGAIPYKYWPSRGTVSPADNAIRNFLGSWALARWGKFSGNDAFRLAARRNLRFNLRRYFKPIGDGRGAIVESSGAKLGAAAIAGLAILENSGGDEFVEELSMLGKGINSLADDKLGFRTFFFPQERDGENWNFYSGEALLFWAVATRLGLPTAPSISRCVSTFETCRSRHYRRRNPAFVPWHTQACAVLYGLSGCRNFADFTFEINDWLLPMQQWHGLPPDMKGRFYDPARPEFGPPHAASTGVYLEGLATAVSLARMVNDPGRVSAYEVAIGRGLRSLRQLQFRGAHDAFYVSKKKRVIGALRTEVYDNAIRIDSAAHALLAAERILRQTGVEAPELPVPNLGSMLE
ncbi:MAG: hypothetical protein OXI87_13515 [Albidovulum sp.]|nr:hypothetical protein [Albidovulum sp.]MDE0530573.1 hypothetical protein [Albidovulum sp.]